MITIKLNSSDELPINYTGIVEQKNGTKVSYFKEGKLHRENGPAVEESGEYKSWYKEGKLHREDGPAVEHSNGDEFWYKEGKRHRVDGPAVELETGLQRWYVDGHLYAPTILWFLIQDSSIFLKKEKGKYGLEWLKILTKDGIEEFPIMPGMDLDKVEGYKKWTMTLSETE